MTQQLEYATSATDRVPWGPILIRPSRRTVVLLVFTVATAAWFSAKHAPWVETATLSVPGRPARFDLTATPDFQLGDDVLLSSHDSPTEVTAYDADTGRPIRTFGQETGPDPRAPIGYYLVPRTGLVLERSVYRDTARLLDPRTGTARAMAVGRTPPGRIHDVAPHATGVTVLYAGQPINADSEPGALTFGLWRPFDGAAQNPIQTFAVPPGTVGRISPDGATVLFWSTVRAEPPKDLTPAQRENWRLSVAGGWRTQLARLYDAHTGDLLVELHFRDPRTTPAFSADGRVLVSLFEPNFQSDYATLAAGTAWARSVTPTPPPPGMPSPASPAIERHDTRTGRLLSSAASPTGTLSARPFADGRFGLVEVASNTRGVLFSRQSYVTELTRPTPAPPTSSLPQGTPRSPLVTETFPDGKRMLIGGGWGAQASIVDANADQALAKLHVPGFSVDRVLISPDGNRLALRGDGGRGGSGDVVHLFRRAGFECRESHFGVLGMPHVWLLGGLLAALAFSLRADARRAQSAGTLTPLVSTIALLMLVAALPRSFHALLTALIGSTLPTPAPLLLVAAIGLATGSRFWRLAAIAVLAGVASVSFYSLGPARSPGFATPVLLQIIDRTYEIDRHAVFGTFLAGALLAAAATFPIVRAPRAIQ